jgi:hypothetical protein
MGGLSSCIRATGNTNFVIKPDWKVHLREFDERGLLQTDLKVNKMLCPM